MAEAYEQEIAGKAPTCIELSKKSQKECQFLESVLLGCHQNLFVRNHGNLILSGADKHAIKIIVCSHRNYNYQLSTAMLSLYKIGFKNFNDLIVVISGEPQDVEPTLTPLCDITSTNIQDSVVVVRKKMNNYEYTSFQVLYEGLQHPLISADGYVCLHDTVTFHPFFAEVWDSFSFKIPDTIYTFPLPNANLVAMGREVAERYKDNFNCQLTKEQGVKLEVYGKEVAGCKSVLQYSDNIIMFNNRIKVGEEDIYHTGALRTKIFCPMLGVYKYAFWDQTGDIMGSTRTLDQGEING